MTDEYEEITLADLVGTLGRRKFILGSVFLLVLLGGIAFTVFSPPEYESTTTLVPLEHGDIITNWLDARHAGELVASAMGEPLVSELFPSRWDASSGTWIGDAPTLEDAGRELATATTVNFRDDRANENRFLSLTVRLTDPLLARDVANAYIATLDELRPVLEDITQQEAFDQYYDGSNKQEAEGRAEVTAQQLEYWLVLDTANTPQSPVSPNVALNIALSIVLGLMLGVFSVFFAEWLRNYRAERKDAAPTPATKEEPVSTPKRERRYE